MLTLILLQPEILMLYTTKQNEVGTSQPVDQIHLPWGENSVFRLVSKRYMFCALNNDKFI